MMLLNHWIILKIIRNNNIVRMDNADGYFERRRNDDHDYNNNIGINMNINMNELNSIS
jgi:hypothetical protein